MFLIDQQLLSKMWNEKKVAISVEFHEVEYRGHEGWEARIVTDEGTALFMNARGEPRRWRQLNAAVNDIKAVMPGAREFKVITST